jgi:hypothetical protein
MCFISVAVSIAAIASAGTGSSFVVGVAAGCCRRRAGTPRRVREAEGSRRAVGRSMVWRSRVIGSRVGA